MILKDASAFNIQFRHGRPLLVDTLSFEKYEEGTPWVAYRQFCQHFLAPLALMSYKDYRLNQLFRVYLDGIPLNLSSSLLPKRTFLRLSLLSHLHLHARAQKYFGDKPPVNQKRQMSRQALSGLVGHLDSTIKKLRWRPAKTEWSGYYQEIHYSPKALGQKISLVSEFLEAVSPECVWDLGANTGLFSRLASDRQIMTLAFDIDHAAVEKNYLQSRQKKETHILPLVLDLTNPTSGFGWAHEERASLLERGPAEAILALALIHHLSLSNNVPLERISGFLASLGKWLIIEYIPKSDQQVQKLLAHRPDIYADYTEEVFEKSFSAYFRIKRKVGIVESDRSLYLMERKVI